MADLLLALLIFVVAPLVCWMAYMARDANRVHQRKCQNCIFYVPERAWNGDLIPPEPGMCQEKECVNRW